MNKIYRIGTKQKIVAAILTLVILIAVALYVSYNNYVKTQKIQKQLFLYQYITKELIQLRSDNNKLNLLTLEFKNAQNEDEREAIVEKLQTRLSQLRMRSSVIDSLLAGVPAEKKNYAEIYNFIKLILFDREKLIFDYQSKGSMALNDHKIAPQLEIYEDVSKSIYKLEERFDTLVKQFIVSKEKQDKTTLLLHLSIGGGMSVLMFLFVILLFRVMNRVTSEIKTGATIVGESSAGILSLVTEISTAAAETAAAVSETTVTIEEIHQTSLVSNQKAQNLLLSSQRAADSVENGRESIASVIDAMKNIDVQMDLILDTINKLADQNRSIGEITSTVADIADQTNLLAVNAAIEAAKAGEHGRGFTVVAQEIRSLADQSKKATFQIKDILNEITKSVNHAVGVTEKGAKTVEDGKKLVVKSGEIIEILAENVEEASQASVQISASNQQQMAGIEQIVPAMTNIKQASEQNVQGIKQAQGAAQNLNQLGLNLKHVIEKYKL